MDKECTAVPAVIAFGLCAAIALTGTPAWGDSATDQLKATLDQIITVLKNPELKSPRRAGERSDALHALLNQRFDKVEFAKRALGKRWRNIAPQQQQEFAQLFSSLLERTYFEKIDAYLAKSDGFSEKNIVYLNERKRGPYVIVETKVTIDSDAEIPVLYQMKSRQDSWLVCDIAIEGVSLLKNYRVQFNDIIAGSSFEDLIKRLKTKAAAEAVTRH